MNVSFFLGALLSYLFLRGRGEGPKIPGGLPPGGDKIPTPGGTTKLPGGGEIKWPTLPGGWGLPFPFPGGGGENKPPPPDGGGGVPPGGGEVPPAGPKTHVIKEGDYPSGLAKKKTGDGGRWRELLTVNPEMSTYTDSKGQTQIKPWKVGQKIILPPGWA